MDSTQSCITRNLKTLQAVHKNGKDAKNHARMIFGIFLFLYRAPALIRMMRQH